MAEKQTVTKMIRCRTVQPYGGIAAGQSIEVTQQEYDRLRVVVPKGDAYPARYRYPVLATEEHAAEAVLAERTMAEALEKSRRVEGEAGNGPAWAEMERQSRAEMDRRALAAAAEAEAKRKELLGHATDRPAA